MNAINVNRLKKSFVSPTGESQVVLDIDSFTLAEGSQLAIRGESGSGKTTFLHALAGMIDVDGGEIRICGTAMTGLSEAKRDSLRARTMGYVFQTFNLLNSFSVLENVCLGMAFGDGVDEGRARDLLSQVGLSERLHHKPSQLSTGQQQRVAIARALANNPAVVLADEPTGNLDAKHAQEAIDLIKALCQREKAALLFVTHDDRALASFDTVLDFAEINGMKEGSDIP